LPPSWNLWRYRLLPSVLHDEQCARPKECRVADAVIGARKANIIGVSIALTKGEIIDSLTLEDDA